MESLTSELTRDQREGVSKMVKLKIDEESTEEVFNFIGRAFAQEQEETFIKKLRNSICIDLDSRMRKITRDSGKNISRHFSLRKTRKPLRGINIVYTNNISRRGVEEKRHSH